MEAHTTYLESHVLGIVSEASEGRYFLFKLLLHSKMTPWRPSPSVQPVEHYLLKILYIHSVCKEGKRIRSVD